jgi:hypothetical protein
MSVSKTLSRTTVRIRWHNSVTSRRTRFTTHDCLVASPVVSSGVLPQLVGVAPEKAIKPTVNDLVRGKFTDKATGNIWTGWEVLEDDTGTVGRYPVVDIPLLMMA